MALKKKPLKISLTTEGRRKKKIGELEVVSITVPNTDALFAITLGSKGDKPYWAITHRPTGCAIGLGENGSQADGLRRAKKFYKLLSDEGRTAFRTDDFRQFGKGGIHHHLQSEFAQCQRIVSMS